MKRSLEVVKNATGGEPNTAKGSTAVLAPKNNKPTKKVALPPTKSERFASEARRRVTNNMTTVNTDFVPIKGGIMEGVLDEERTRLMQKLNDLPNKGWIKKEK